jgi:hypothetical protein
MNAFSASQAVWPAIERTYRCLFRPFQWAAFLKTTALATVTEGILVSFRFTVSNELPFDIRPIDPALLLAPEFVSFTMLAVAVAIFLGFLSIYAVIRLRFVFFHCLLHETREIGPAWDLYRVPAMRLFKASLLVALFLLILAGLAVGVVVLGVITVLTARTEEGLLDPGNFLIVFFPCLGIALALVVTAVLAEVILHDLILPHMALENLTVREAWAAVRQRIRTHRDTFLSYFILRLLLPFLAIVILVIAASILNWIVFGVLGMSAAGFNAMLEDATGAGAYFRIAVQGLFILLGLGAGSLLAVVLGGPLAVYIRGYALVYYGGHYKPLGDILFPPPETPDHLK